MEFSPENQEDVPVVETVRAALFHRGKFLILQKDKTARNAGALEFPGGKVDKISGTTSTAEEQKQATMEEVQEETGISIKNFPIEEIDKFSLYFEATEKDGAKKKYRRLVHLFLIRLPDEQEFTLKINETKNAQGESEDKHADYRWVSPEDLVESATVLKENPETKEKVYPLTQNSRHIKKLLKAVSL